MTRWHPERKLNWFFCVHIGSLLFKHYYFSYYYNTHGISIHKKWYYNKFLYQMATVSCNSLRKTKMIILGWETRYLIIESSSFRPLIFDSSSLHSTDVHFFDTKSFSLFFRRKQKSNFYNIIFLIIVEYKSNQWMLF